MSAKKLELLAFDYGASNGRAILGRFDGERIEMEEIHRFENNYVNLNGGLYWDILSLYRETLAGMQAAAKLAKPAAFGIDTWGVDYGLLDKNGALLGQPRSYRMASPEDKERAHAVISRDELFYRTGITDLDFNTLYQLYRRKVEGDGALESAKTLLMLPDLLNYLLTGEKAAEYTNATTTMMLDPHTKDWARDVLTKLGLDSSILPGIRSSATLLGGLLPDVRERVGCDMRCAMVGSHDTASAVAAIPGEGSFAFCSSGTWSLFGMESDVPLMSEAVCHSGLANEGTVQGGFRPLKNIMGLWIIQCCRRQWQAEGLSLSWDDIVQAAKQAPALRSLIDTDDNTFFLDGDMCGKIRNYCRETNQPVPETVGEIARCVYESLALKYRAALEKLEAAAGRGIDRLNIVGGGIQNRFLNQLIADAIDRPVVTGPIEGAAMGNLLTQAMALGEIGSIRELRQVVKNSVQLEVWESCHTQAWEDAWGRMRKMM